MARILIVEDAPDVLELLRETLTAEGYEVIIARDGLAARQLLASPRGVGPDLVVLDLMLPHVDGSVLLSEIRRGGDLPVLVLSAKDAVYTKGDMLRLGADDYVTKPFDLADLTARLEALLRPATPSAAAPPEPVTPGPRSTPAPRACTSTASKSRSPRPSCGCCTCCWPPPGRCSPGRGSTRRCGRSRSWATTRR